MKLWLIPVALAALWLANGPSGPVHVSCAGPFSGGGGGFPCGSGSLGTQGGGGGAPGIARVQGALGADNSSGASVATAFTSAVASGDLVVGMVTWDATLGTTLASVTDDKGNTYNLGTHLHDSTHNQDLELFYLGNITNAPKTLTASFAGSAPNCCERLTLDEYSGVTGTTDGMLGTVNQAPGTGNDGLSSGSFTTTTKGDLIYAVATITSGSTTFLAGTGFTARNSVGGSPNVNDVTTEDAVQSNPGATSGTFTLNTSTPSECIAIAFKASP